MSTDETISEALARSHGSDQLSAQAVVDRMKECWACETDAQLARHLKTSRGNISRWKSRNTVPYPEAVYTATATEKSLTYILTGRGGERGPVSAELMETYIDEELIRRILYEAHSLAVMRVLDNDEPKRDLDILAHGVAHQYNKTYRFIKAILDQKRLDYEEARLAALAGFDLMFADDDTYGARKSARRRKSGKADEDR